MLAWARIRVHAALHLFAPIGGGGSWLGRGMHVLRAWDGKLCDVKALRGTGARAHRVCDAIAPPCGAKIEESGTDASVWRDISNPCELPRAWVCGFKTVAIALGRTEGHSLHAWNHQ